MAEAGDLSEARALAYEDAVYLDESHGAHNYSPLPVALARGQGVFVWDVEGKRYFDFLSGYSALNQGHCHPQIVAAMAAQAGRLALPTRAFYNDCLGPFSQYATQLFGYSRILPMNTGVEGVETALKLCRRWGYEIKGIPENQAQIIVCTGNFHGRTLAVISASSDWSARRGFGPYTPGFIPIPFNDLVALEKALENPSVAGFLVEPIQGEAGVIVPAAGYLAQAAVLCRRAKVLLIADEVQTGLGRTGRRLACDHEGVRPDVLILGKALSGGMLPVSAVLADDEIMLVLKPGEHGSTFGGNPIACQVAMAALKVVEEECLAEKAELLGDYFRRQLMEQCGQWVQEVRGKGLMNAMVFRNGHLRSSWNFCLRLRDHGLLARAFSDGAIRLTPPLVITLPQLKESLEILKESFMEAAKELHWPDVGDSKS